MRVANVDLEPATAHWKVFEEDMVSQASLAGLAAVSPYATQGACSKV